MSKTLTFDLSNAEERETFANLCAALNKAGLPWGTLNRGLVVTVTIGDGY